MKVWSGYFQRIKINRNLNIDTHTYNFNGGVNHLIVAVSNPSFELSWLQLQNSTDSSDSTESCTCTGSSFRKLLSVCLFVFHLNVFIHYFINWCGLFFVFWFHLYFDSVNGFIFVNHTVRAWHIIWIKMTFLIPESNWNQMTGVNEKRPRDNQWLWRNENVEKSTPF